MAVFQIVKNANITNHNKQFQAKMLKYESSIISKSTKAIDLKI